ncbi:hypothetical protein PTTW11_05593 [Pyrenophora teres f. teres]|uniref:Uncharacterized protein n=1 Tax=Pyrenophora teres f. teres TaxID=97479 RepID=A0A6S6W437_9PLEO|nr:hypothetical protein PTTW11_05593 [Pyrenophora teres f. teres]
MSATSSSFPAIAKASLCDAFSPTASFASINCDTGAHSRVRRHQPPTTSHNWLQQALIGSFNARRSLNISKTRLVGQMHHLWVLPVDSLQTFLLGLVHVLASLHFAWVTKFQEP